MSRKDRLTLAAQAYFGAGNFEWNDCTGFAGAIQYIPKGLTYYVNWEPDSDYGDALRLALSLDISVNLNGSQPFLYVARRDEMVKLESVETESVCQSIVEIAAGFGGNI